MKTMEGNEPFDWNVLVSLLVHPVQVAIIEAMSWIGTPLSASELDKVLDERFGVSHVSYHMRALVKAEVIGAVDHEQVRGALKTFYFFS
jgi:hypothetical protein